MTDRRISQVLGCQDDDLPLVDSAAPAYAYREAHEAENDDANARMVMVAIVAIILMAAIVRYWVWPGVQSWIERQEIVREGR